MEVAAEISAFADCSAKGQENSMKFQFPDLIGWKAVKGGAKSEEQSKPEGTIRERLALAVGV